MDPQIHSLLTNVSALLDQNRRPRTPGLQTCIPEHSVKCDSGAGALHGPVDRICRS